MPKVSLFIVIWVLSSICYLTPFAVVANDEARTNEQLEAVKKAIAKQQASLKQSNKARDKILAELKRDDIAIAKAAKTLSKTQTSLKQTAEKLVALKKQQKQLTEQKKITRAITGQTIKSSLFKWSARLLKIATQSRRYERCSTHLKILPIFE